MALWSEWSDGKKWLMGILSALIVAGILGGVGKLMKLESDGESSGTKETPEFTGDRVAKKGLDREAPGPPNEVVPAMTPTPTTESSHQGQPAKAALVDTAEGITITLQRCRLDGDRVDCEFSVTSDEDEEVMLFGESRLIEADGNEIAASKIAFGDQKVEGHLSSVAEELVRNVPVKAGATFEGVNLNFNTLRLIELRCAPANFRFQNIALQ